MTDCLVKQESPMPERRIALTLAAHLDPIGAPFGSLSRPVLPVSGHGKEAEYKPVCVIMIIMVCSRAS